MTTTTGSTTGRRRPDPTVATGLLTLLVAVLGVLVLVRVEHRPLLNSSLALSTVAAAVALGLVFFLTELGQALVELRRQAYSFSMAGVPLLLGLLYLPPVVLVVVRLATALLAFAVQRAAPIKMVFNTASYLLDTALVVLLAQALVPAGARLDVRTALLCYVALAVVDILMSLLVLLVIWIHQGPISRSDIVEVLGQAAVFVAVNCLLALLAATLLGAGALGGLLLAGLVAVTGLAYRGFLVLRARHRSLQTVQDFVSAGEQAETVQQLAETLLVRLRAVLRAARVELWLLDGPGGNRLLVAGEDGVDVGAPGQTPDDVLDAALSDGVPRLIGGRHPGEADRSWLAGHGVRDALVVPLPGAETRGVVLALDRVGDSTSFSGDDLALLQTLAGHLAVALHGRRLVDRLRTEATHDGLTGLANRTRLRELVKQHLETPGTGPAAVLLLDLNRFKEVNDALGHHVGDELLQVVAERLRTGVRADAVVARLGGDEFAVLLPTPNPPRNGSSPPETQTWDASAAATAAARAAVEAGAAACQVAERLTAALAAPVQLPGVLLSTEASIGIAVARPGEDDGDLLRHADTAMYAAKSGGLRMAVYEPELDRGRAGRLALLADLHQALDDDVLTLDYQPQLDLATGTVRSVEALVRWHHPVQGPIGPDQFIPLAESTGLIDRLTRTVLDMALRQCRDWRRDGLDLTVSVNLSARNLSTALLPQQVAEALVRWQVPAERLVLEITESAVMGDAGRTVPTLERLAAMGVELALDDFGTGQSSLSYLQRLPVRELKIDRSFVTGLDASPTDRSSELLVRSILGLAHGLGLRVVAEGSETGRSLGLLRSMGCDLVQGYHVSRPVPASRVPEALASSRQVATSSGHVW